MVPEMRRRKQQLSTEECTAILRDATYGVLGTAGTDGYPYAVPLSFAYEATAAEGAPVPARCHRGPQAGRPG